MAIEAQGTEFFWSTATTVASTSTSCLVGEITDFSGPGGQAAIIDVTNLNSTAKEKLVGLRDEGQLSLSLNLSFSDTAQGTIRTDRANRTKRKVVIKFNDSTDDKTKTKALMDAYCLGFSVSGAVDNKVSANAVIEITGPVLYSNSTVIPIP
jgi:hypothetical protein